ncbi:MAG TPA: phytanoyl-CoA dioxygenase family protein [Acidimicrobiia bacterium]|nr:phytanoyl-CoA dioxygenase family protein [Acidimicrobiia bacterium]
MTIDTRTRLHKDVRSLARDEVIDSVLPDAIAVHGDLAARGVTYKDLPALGLDVDGRGVTLGVSGGVLALRDGLDDARVVAVMAADALSDLVQDTQSTMGLAMTARVQLIAGTMPDWIGWEPVLRALLDGREVHETGAVTFTDRDGGDLDLDRSFTIDDDHEEIAHFLEQAGFLHVRDVFTDDEMAAVGVDIDEWIARATPDDGDSWWATDEHGVDQAVRVLNFYDKSAALRALVHDDRYQWIGDLTGDGHRHKGGGEGLVKPLGIVRGLSDLPWHKDCGQGRHSYICSGLTCGISVTGADRTSGALGVIPGSHRANTMATGRDPALDLRPRLLETRTGDVTVHCSDTLHRAFPPVDRPRKVVYSGFGLPPLPGDVIEADPRYSNEARAELSSVQDRIEAADNPDDPRRYRAGRGR